VRSLPPLFGGALVDGNGQMRSPMELHKLAPADEMITTTP